MSLPETDPQILERSGFAGEVRLGKLLSDGFRSRTLAERSVVLVNRTLRFGFCMFELFRKISLKTSEAPCLEHTTQILCLFHRSYCTVCAILFTPFAGRLFYPAVCEDALIPEFASRYCLV